MSRLPRPLRLACQVVHCAVEGRAVWQPVLGFPHTFTSMALRGASRNLCGVHQRMVWSLVVAHQRETGNRRSRDNGETPSVAGVAIKVT
jgi:hypothetical protein